MPRASKRTGTGPNRGSINPKITISILAPNSPKENDIWMDSTDLRIFYYDSSEWIQISASVILWEAGENLSQGETVYVSQSDGKIYKNPIDGTTPLGVIFANVTSGDDAIIVSSGIAYVLPDAADSITRGYIIYSSSSTAGRVDSSTNWAGVTANTFIGYALESSSGAGVLTRCVIK